MNPSLEIFSGTTVTLRIPFTLGMFIDFTENNHPVHLVLLSILIGFVLVFISATPNVADPRLASHLQKPFSDTGTNGYQDRIPWAITSPPKIDWIREFKHLERFRAKQYLKNFGKREQKQRYIGNRTSTSTTPTTTLRP